SRHQSRAPARRPRAREASQARNVAACPAGASSRSAPESRRRKETTPLGSGAPVPLEGAGDPFAYAHLGLVAQDLSRTRNVRERISDVARARREVFEPQLFLRQERAQRVHQLEQTDAAAAGNV